MTYYRLSLKSNTTGANHLAIVYCLYFFNFGLLITSVVSLTFSCGRSVGFLFVFFLFFCYFVFFYISNEIGRHNITQSGSMHILPKHIEQPDQTFKQPQTPVLFRNS